MLTDNKNVQGSILPIISYGAFYDFPHEASVKVRDYLVILQSNFDDSIDDYKDYYDVFAVTNVRPEEIKRNSSGQGYEQVYLGKLPIAEVKFDATRRTSLQSAKLEAMVRDACL